MYQCVKIIITDSLLNLWNILKYVQYIILGHKNISVDNMTDENINYD